MAKKKQPKKLTRAQRIQMLLTPCKTRKAFKGWIKYHLGLELPDCTVSRYSDTNPEEIIWELYQILVLKKNPENINEILCVAGRGTGKTLGMAILELMVILHDQRDAVHVGATMGQADRCYTYVKNFLYNRKLKDIVSPPKTPDEDKILEKANMSKSVFNVNKEKVTLEVLPCTLKACNGPHVPLVVVDEIDTVNGEGFKAFKEISGMLDSKGGKKAMRIGISTRKSRYGLMNQQIENAEQEDREVRRWTAFEFTERCPDSVSGTDPIDLYLIQEDMDVIDEETYEKKAKAKKREYVKHTFPGSGCAKCPIAAICIGDAKKQKSKSPMLKPLDELIKKVVAEGADWALAQLMNLKPSVEGIIYREFDERKHVLTWNEMWFKLVGKEFPGECDHDTFIKKCHSMGLPCFAGVDWGWSNPCTVVYFFVDKKDNVYIVRADGMTFISQPGWIHHMRSKYQNMYKCQLYFPDVADQGAVEEMKKAGLPVSNNVDKAINTGIQVIKKFLRIPGSQEPKMFLAGETCKPLVEEFGMYHFKTDAAGIVTEQPESEYDHWLDALRYPMSMLFGKSVMIGAQESMIDDSVSVMDAKTMSFHRMPSVSEFADSQGINFNNEVDTSKLGKIGNKNEIEEDEEDIGGDGGFLWSL